MSHMEIYCIAQDQEPTPVVHSLNSGRERRPNLRHVRITLRGTLSEAESS